MFSILYDEQSSKDTRYYHRQINKLYSQLDEQHLFIVYKGPQKYVIEIRSLSSEESRFNSHCFL